MSSIAKKQRKVFQMIAASIFIFFMAMFAFVVVKAYSRKSGFAGMDMSKVQKIRQEASQK